MNITRRNLHDTISCGLVKDGLSSFYLIQSAQVTHSYASGCRLIQLKRSSQEGSLFILTKLYLLQIWSSFCPAHDFYAIMKFTTCFLWMNDSDYLLSCTFISDDPNMIFDALQCVWYSISTIQFIILVISPDLPSTVEICEVWVKPVWSCVIPTLAVRL